MQTATSVVNGFAMAPRGAANAKINDPGGAFFQK